ncbi:hypothetical protein CBS147346_3102 [Aspergillus niger]|nr:hypothetical protein CBS147346_3102 [Aspergillus niger]
MFWCLLKEVEQLTNPGPLICVSDVQSNLIVSLFVGFQTKQSGSTRYLALFRIGALAVTSSTIQFNKTSISC